MRGQIRKRGKSWAVIVYLGRDPHTGTKRRRWFTHRTRTEAEAHLAQLLVQVQAGAGVPPSRLRLADYLERWLQDYARARLALTTLRSYEDTVRVHLTPALGHVPLPRLSAPTDPGISEPKAPARPEHHDCTIPRSRAASGTSACGPVGSTCPEPDRLRRSTAVAPEGDGGLG
jgi:hypothetical protein